MAAQGLEGTEAAILRDKNAKSAAAKITTTEDSSVETTQHSDSRQDGRAGWGWMGLGGAGQGGAGCTKCVS